MSKKKGQEREKGRSWDVETPAAIDTPARRPYKSMSFTASEMAQECKGAEPNTPPPMKAMSKRTVFTGIPTSPNTIRRKSNQKYAGPKREKTKDSRQKKVIDASTQTTMDAATQTSDEENEFQDEITMDERFLHTSFGSVEEDSCLAKFQSLSFGIQTDLKKRPADHHIFHDLNDLENEIAKIRYKALSIQESIKWLEREKKYNERPNRPVGEDDEIPTRDTDSFAFVPVDSKFERAHTKLHGKRTLSVPIVLSTPLQFDNPPSRVALGPDQSKFKQIPESSAFNKPIPGRLSHIRKHSKSLNDLPELKITFTPDNRAIVEDAVVARRLEKERNAKQ